MNIRRKVSRYLWRQIPCSVRRGFKFSADNRLRETGSRRMVSWRDFKKELELAKSK